MAERVLTTGATGLIGRAVVPLLLDAGFEVVVFSRHGGAFEGADEQRGDLLDQSSMENAVRKAEATHLLHLAWHDGQRDRWTSPANFDWAAATLRLVRSFSAAGGTRAVCVGSCAEYDWSEECPRETTPLRPTSIYGAAKSATGTALVAAAPSLGISLAWARVFFCYGPGEPEGRLLGDLIKGLSAGKAVDCTDGEQVRDFMHTDDVARALVHILKSEIEGPVNVGSGQETAVKELIQKVASQMNATDLINLGARRRPENDPARIIADATILQEHLGFKPHYDNETGINAVLRSEGVV